MAVAVDTMKFVALLRGAGVCGRHAEAIARTVKSEAAGAKAEVAKIRGDVRVLKWRVLLAILSPAASAILYNFLAG